MIGVSRSFVALRLLLFFCCAISPSLSATAGSFADGGTTGVSAMMMFLGTPDRVYILDKAENNAEIINGHPAWGAAWDANTHEHTLMDVRSNVFCASGMHLPNGSYVTFGGNNAVGPGGNTPPGPDGTPETWDPTFQDFDGRKSIRILNPCTADDNFADPKCQWFDDASVLSMQRQRWYSGAEALEDGSVIILGGFVNGGYINRNYPNTDPEFEGGAADCTYEYYPSRNQPAQTVQFLKQTSGLNAYALAYMMPSGKLFVQANVSTMLWDHNANVETPLPPMPGNVVRVYPASGANAMLPLTPANNYEPTILFCGGSDMPDSAWGDYANPAIDTFNYPASQDCQRITPEPQDGSQPAYVKDDDMLEGRTMGQFIILPTGKYLLINGGANGTAGYSQKTGQTPTFDQMPWGESLASGPRGTPALYDPDAPAGQRWSNKGFATSDIPRLYHSSGMMLADGSVMIAGSNPNVDTNLSTVFPTTYKVELFYPSYFASSTRPVPSGVPKTLSYGGDYFNITIPPTSYSGSANDAAAKTKVAITRGGFTTHAMNMGQRYLQLNNTYTVQDDGTIVLHCAQPPPIPHIFQPGPGLLWVVVDGVPSNGTMLIVGSGEIGPQPTAAASILPDSVLAANNVNGGGSSSGSSDSGAGNTESSTTPTGVIVGGVVGGVAVLGAVVAAVVFFMRRRSTNGVRGAYSRGAAASSYDVSGTALEAPKGHMLAPSDSSSFTPINQENRSNVWNAGSMASLGEPNAPYRDEPRTSMGSAGGYGGYPMQEQNYDPYARATPGTRF